MAAGIRKLHSKGCRGREAGRCRCGAGYEAWVWSNRDGKKIRKTFELESEAKTWRADALSALAKGGLRAPKPTTVQEAWHESAKDGTVRNRSGDPYKPSVIRSYEKSMRLRVLPEFASTRLADLRRIDVQDFVDELLADGLAPSTINTTLHPLRVICRRGVNRGDLIANPCSGLELPTARGRRERFASPVEAETLITASPGSDRRYGRLRSTRGSGRGSCGRCASWTLISLRALSTLSVAGTATRARSS
jgi:hypothetical protein